jgi:hypothetical protein
VLDLHVQVLPFFSLAWLPPLLSFISSSLPLLLPYYLSTIGSFQPRSREFATPLDLWKNYARRATHKNLAALYIHSYHLAIKPRDIQMNKRYDMHTTWL